MITRACKYTNPHNGFMEAEDYMEFENHYTKTPVQLQVTVQVCGCKEKCMHFILPPLYLGDILFRKKYCRCISFRHRTAEVADMYTCVITYLHGMTTTTWL